MAGRPIEAGGVGLNRDGVRRMAAGRTGPCPALSVSGLGDGGDEVPLSYLLLI